MYNDNNNKKYSIFDNYKFMSIIFLFQFKYNYLITSYQTKLQQE